MWALKEREPSKGDTRRDSYLGKKLHYEDSVDDETRLNYSAFLGGDDEDYYDDDAF